MIKELKIAPGPRMGWILNALLEEVLDAPEKNTVEHLSELVKSLNMLGDDELRTLGERGKEKKEELEEEEVAKLHKKHGVNFTCPTTGSFNTLLADNKSRSTLSLADRGSKRFQTHFTFFLWLCDFFYRTYIFYARSL